MIAAWHDINVAQNSNRAMFTMPEAHHRTDTKAELHMIAPPLCTGFPRPHRRGKQAQRMPPESKAAVLKRFGVQTGGARTTHFDVRELQDKKRSNQRAL